MTADENEIVVYQPDDTTRLSVRFDGETVWLSQEQMIELFQRDRSVISRHIANAFKEGEVDKENCLHILQTNTKGRPEVVYNLEVVTSVGYRVKSLRGVMFIRRAKKELIVIDAYPGVATLDMLAKRGRGVKIGLAFLRSQNVASKTNVTEAA